MLARDRNGTGKTGAFAIPVLNQVDFNAPYPQAIIIAHTKELSMQLARNIKQFGQELNIEDKVLCLVGGTDIQEDIARTKKNPTIIVGTPGRINNFIRNDHIKTKKIKMLVIDEADKLIGTESFEDDVISIIQACPKTVQKCLFSATFPQSVEAFCTKYLNDPEMINCMTNSLTLKGITQYIANVKEEKYKVMLINVLFKTLQINQCIIFVNKF